MRFRRGKVFRPRSFSVLLKDGQMAWFVPCSGHDGLETAILSFGFLGTSRRRSCEVGGLFFFLPCSVDFDMVLALGSLEGGRVETVVVEWISRW